tara:strand:+ start:290 stop:1180 length:891 start_codon:yes stop_codon:yes gene_type:complete
MSGTQRTWSPENPYSSGPQRSEWEEQNNPNWYNYKGPVESGSPQQIEDIYTQPELWQPPTNEVRDLDTVISDLTTEYQGEIDYDQPKDESFGTRMEQNVQALGDTVNQESGEDIKSLSLDNVGKAIDENQGNLSNVTEYFTGLSDNVDTLTSDIQKQYYDDGTSGLTGDTSSDLKQSQDQFNYGDSFVSNKDKVDEAFYYSDASLNTDLSADGNTTLDPQLDKELNQAQTNFTIDTDISNRDFNKQLQNIFSKNYSTLGDSAQGVKIRRSKAFKEGLTRSGTGQLNRSMKINTLNM